MSQPTSTKNKAARARTRAAMKKAAAKKPVNAVKLKKKRGR